jgi:hypothetical protein
MLAIDTDSRVGYDQGQLATREEARRVSWPYARALRPPGPPPARASGSP